MGYHVVKLKRIRIMNINLDLKVGEFRDLSKSELKELNRLITTILKRLFKISLDQLSGWY